jgi:putative sugar O-methyltransferase
MSSDERVASAIDDMTEEVMSGPEIYRPSHFWDDLNARNRRQIDEIGFASFKRTVNQNYFNWLIVDRRDPQFRRLLRSWLMRPRLSIFGARIEDWENVELAHDRTRPFRRQRARIWYAVFVALLWEFARRRDTKQRLDLLQEPRLGNPILIRYGRRSISQDVANSALELRAIEEALLHPLATGETVIEIGAGYGRLAWMMLALTPGLRYIIVDIPPALAIAQEYLTSLFGERKAFHFRHFDRYEDVAGELGEAEIVFLTPNQLEVIPAQNADLFVNISSFHEMRIDQVANFLGQVGRHTNGIFYTKQWRAWTNKLDGVTIRQEDYPIPASWERVYEREHPVQTQFFEAAYRIAGSAPAEVRDQTAS